MLKLVPGFKFYHLINSVSVNCLPRQNSLFAKPESSVHFPLQFALKVNCQHPN